MVILDFYLVSEYGNILDDSLNELVFLDGIHEVPDGVEVRKRFADLFRGEVAAVLVHALRLRENPEEDLPFFSPQTGKLEKNGKKHAPVALFSPNLSQFFFGPLREQRISDNPRWRCGYFRQRNRYHDN